MATYGSVILPNEYIFLRLPNGSLKPVECRPNQTIELSKLGNVPVRSLLGRPYYHTYEIQEKTANETHSALKIVPPSELNAEAIASEVPATENDDGDVISNKASTITKDNRLTVDDGSRQTLSHEEIEELKKTSDGKAIIEKILAGHAALSEKTEFSKAKYTLRKAKKYLKQFSTLPMELGYLIEWILEREPARIMELREESLGLIGSWSNAHWHGEDELYDTPDGKKMGGGRLLVVDDTGGLVTAALAERKDILRKSPSLLEPTNGTEESPNNDSDPTNDKFSHKDFPQPVHSNSITLLHSAVQPNISLLKYFGYDSNQPDVDHPLHTHLNTLSWLQLLYPDEDPLHREPPSVSEDIVNEWKTGKRSTYYKKRRRWERVKSVGDDTRTGSFDGLVIASHIDLVSILSRTIPLLRGGAQVVVYSPTVEPLVKLVDFYSKERRAAFVSHLMQHGHPPIGVEDFPLDPRLLLSPMLQTSRIREYQVLPGRTHPLMTSRGGSEGYIFTAQKVIPAAGGVVARGNVAKRRKTADAEDSPAS